MNMAPAPTDTARAVREANAALRGAQAHRARVDAALATAHEAAAPHVEAELHLADARARLEDALAAAAIGQADAASVARCRDDVAAAERALSNVAAVRDGAEATAAGLQRRQAALDAETAQLATAVTAAEVAHIDVLWREADAEALELGRKYAAAVARTLALRQQLRRRGAPAGYGAREVPELPPSGPVTAAAAHELNPRDALLAQRSFLPRTAEAEAAAAAAVDAELAELAAPAPTLLARAIAAIAR